MRTILIDDDPELVSDLQHPRAENTNTNANTIANTNADTNANTNKNTNANTNANANANTNMKYNAQQSVGLMNDDSIKVNTNANTIGKRSNTYVQ